LLGADVDDGATPGFAVGQGLTPAEDRHGLGAAIGGHVWVGDDHCASAVRDDAAIEEMERRCDRP